MFARAFSRKHPYRSSASQLGLIIQAFARVMKDKLNLNSKSFVGVGE